MAFFDDLKKKVTDTTQGAVKATKELAETARLNAQIGDEQRKIGNLHVQIGQLYYERFAGTAEPPFDALCAEIEASEARIVQLQADIHVIKGIKRCANCGADVPIASSFCSQCGSAMEAQSAAPAPGTDPQAVPEPRHCTNCGAELDGDAAFCTGCGTKVE